jgi:hypothetical protein
VAAWYPQRPDRTCLGWALEGDTVWMLETVEFDVTPMSLPLPGGFTLPSIPGMGSFCCHYNLVSYDGQEWKKRASMPSPFRYGELI